MGRGQVRAEAWAGVHARAQGGGVKGAALRVVGWRARLGGMSHTTSIDSIDATLPRVRRLLAWVCGACAVGSALLFAVWLMRRGLGHVGGKVLLTLVGLSVGAGLANLQVRLGRLKKLLIAGLATIVLSQTAYLLLVWTGWTDHALLWRVWFVAMVPAVSLTHVLLLRHARWLRLARGGGAWMGWTERVTQVLAVVTAALILVLGLRRDLLADPHPVHAWAVIVIWGATALGTAVVIGWYWWHRTWTRPRLSRGGAAVLLVTSHLLLLAVGLYVGHRWAGTAAAEQGAPSPMALLSPEEVRRQTAADLIRLRTVWQGLETLEQELAAWDGQVAAAMREQDRTYYLPDEDDRLRWYFVSFLSYRTELLRLVGMYSGFQAVRDNDARARCFMLAHAAVMSNCQAGLWLVEQYGGRGPQRRKLNEAEPAWGIPAGMFDRISEQLVREDPSRPLEEMAAYYESRREAWRTRGVWETGEWAWLGPRIAEATAYVQARRPPAEQLQLESFLQRVRQDVYNPVYAFQSAVSEWIGDTRIAQQVPCVTPERVEEVRERLRPGDILLERRTWYLSNAFLPGFWPHAALYIGTEEELRGLGVLEDPAVAEHLAALRTAGPDGEKPVVIEAVSEGVILNSLGHTLHADYAAVLRPRLDDAARAEAIVQAFRHVGKPYDFEFDFFTSDKLVCTELIYRVYEGRLHLPLKNVMGRDTLPAVELVHKFARERGREDRELDFVLFLDAQADRTTRFADEDDFCLSAERCRALD